MRQKRQLNQTEQRRRRRLLVSSSSSSGSGSGSDQVRFWFCFWFWLWSRLHCGSLAHQMRFAAYVGGQRRCGDGRRRGEGVGVGTNSELDTRSLELNTWARNLVAALALLCENHNDNKANQRLEHPLALTQPVLQYLTPLPPPFPLTHVARCLWHRWHFVCGSGLCR